MLKKLQILCGAIGLFLAFLIVAAFFHFLETEFSARIQDRQQRERELDTHLMVQCRATWPVGGEHYESCLDIEE